MQDQDAAPSKEDQWNELFNDPSTYWDNRLNKRNPRAPDFKHKATGNGLWINSRDTPAWVPAEVDRLGSEPPMQDHAAGGGGVPF